MGKKLLLIINPMAGQKRAARYLSDILQLFCARDYECTVHMTRGVGDGEAVAREKAASVDLLVCVGGDGTLNEVLSGLVASGAPTPIGYIPAGSTNDFANSLKLSRNILQATRDIVDGTPTPLDVGSFNGRLFSYVASCGAFTKASYSTSQASKNALGHLAYILEGIKDLSTLRPEHLKVETRKCTFEGDYIFAAVSNATSIGGVLTLDEARVSMCDGRLELLLIRFPNNLAELGRIIVSLQTRQYDPDWITFYSTRHMEVTASPDTAWTLDGEFGGNHDRIEIEVRPGAVQWMLSDRRNK